MDKTTINTLIERARILSKGRGSNKGRPREIMAESEAQTVSTMRRQKVSINAIFRVMSEKGLTGYKSYPKFKAAYTNHKLYA